MNETHLPSRHFNVIQVQFTYMTTIWFSIITKSREEFLWFLTEITKHFMIFADASKNLLVRSTIISQVTVLRKCHLILNSFFFSVGRWNTCEVGWRIGLHCCSSLFGLGFGQRCCSGDKNWKWAKNEGELVGNSSQVKFQPNSGYWQVEQEPKTFLEPIWNTIKS